MLHCNSTESYCFMFRLSSPFSSEFFGWNVLMLSLLKSSHTMCWKLCCIIEPFEWVDCFNCVTLMIDVPVAGKSAIFPVNHLEVFSLLIQYSFVFPFSERMHGLLQFLLVQSLPWLHGLSRAWLVQTISLGVTVLSLYYLLMCFLL